MGIDDDIRAANIRYRNAARDGNHAEEARYANIIGNLHKRRGEKLEALSWLRIDYEISKNYLPQEQLYASCQSLGDLYLSLESYGEALFYQKTHLQLANDTNNIIEQQRASTQLGRTFHEIFLRSESDPQARRNAKKYFEQAMKLAVSLRENPPHETTSCFLKEYIYAISNSGMYQMDNDNLEEAEKILLEGLRICEEEEIDQYDRGRAEIHHNLGNLYSELREWNKAKYHIKKEILICKRIGLPEDEVKGLINLGELHYQVQKHDKAILCYQKAMYIAKSMADENFLVDHISQNVETANEASEELKLLIKDEQKLNRLMCATSDASGTADERKFLLQQNVLLESLIEKSSNVCEWSKHLEFAKMKKRVANKLCDEEKHGDSFLVIGESYKMLRNFGKSSKWYMKSWNVYKSIGNLEGQALAKINVGDVLDSSGDWVGALEAFQEGYRISVKENLLSVQLSALNNMHYSHMIRFDNVDETRKLHYEIENVKLLLNGGELLMKVDQDYHSETEREGVVASGDDVDVDVPLRIKRTKKLSKMEMPSLNTRKRFRVITSDEEDEIAGSTAGKWPVMFKAGDDLIYVDMNCCLMGNILDIDYLKVEVACAFFLGLFEEKRSKGLVPWIHQLVCSGKILLSQETIEDMRNLLSQKLYIEVVIGEWVPKRLMKLYMDFCDKFTEATSNRLLKKLFNLEVSEDEVIVSDCALQDTSVLSFLHALEAHKLVALLDISHNSLGNETMEKILQIFTSSNQKYGGLTLDMHCNRFGPTALFQICECPVMFKRLEVLNLSQNRLTDACSSYLSTILENCKALYNLNIEQCSLTSRTIQKLSEFLHDGSALSHLSIGKNNPISGNTMLNLISKLSSLKCFSELSLTGIKLNKTAVEGLCQLPKSSSLSALFLGETCIGADGAVRLTEVLSYGAKELEKLDLAACGITSDVIRNICANIVQIDGIVELNLGGNSIGDEGCYALECMLLDPQCSFKSLILDRCHLGLSGILRIVVALTGNKSLEELHLARNANIANEGALEYHPKSSKSATVCNTNETCRELEVADSKDDKDSKDGADDRSPSICSRLISELSVGIDATKHLQFLDLSENKLSSEAIESLYSSWSSARSRSSLVAYKHENEDHILHFCVVGRRCCGVRSCCRKY